MKRPGLPGGPSEGPEVLPALQRRRDPAPATAAAAADRLRFDARTTRSRRFPVEQSLARLPEPARLGRFLDIEV